MNLESRLRHEHRLLQSLILLFALISGGLAEHAWAWGERGHDLIARVAARLVVKRGEPALARIMADKEHMLGHLANVPDIVWRNMGKETEDVNGPTHYVDLEYLDLKPTFAAMPASPDAALKRMQELCRAAPKGYVCPADNADQVKLRLAGSAPFRIRQLFGRMRDGFAKAKAAAPGDAGSKERNAGVNEALLYGGVMAHFVGDLGNPLHTSRDYNGYERDQGGAHSYYESETVNAFDLKFDEDVWTAAAKLTSLARLEHVVPKDLLASFKSDPLQIAYALTLDSFGKVDEVFALDRKFAVTKTGSTQRGMKINAERRPAAEVAPKFRPLTTERMAIAADTLAALWMLAFDAAGRPDLAEYQSWDYPTTPAFVPPDYE